MACDSSEMRIWRALVIMRFSPADRPFSRSRIERFRRTSATWYGSPECSFSMLFPKRLLQLAAIEDSSSVSTLRTFFTSFLLTTDRRPTCSVESVGIISVRSP